MTKDLNPVLEGWDFLPSKVTARLIDGLEGDSKLQLRIDLGVLQMELDGRPDGRQPMGVESYYTYFREMAEAVEDEKSFDDEGLGLREDDCLKLQQEAVQYYHRYLALFQLEDWPRVIRDTQRNLDLFDFIAQHAEAASLQEMFHNYRPYAQMMNARAWAHLWIEHGEMPRALEVLDDGIAKIITFCHSLGKPEMLQNCEEVRFLENWLQELKVSPQHSQEERLEDALARAIEREDYEAAAKLRDQIAKIEVEQIDKQLENIQTLDEATAPKKKAKPSTREAKPKASRRSSKGSKPTKG